MLNFFSINFLLVSAFDYFNAEDDSFIRPFS